MAEEAQPVGDNLSERFDPQVNILLVDDNPANLLVLRAILEDLGQNLLEARTGEEAIRHMQNAQFAVVLLDVQMPGTNGFETAKLIRAQNPSSHTPVIFLTAYDSDEFPIEEAYSLGAVDYLVKPFLPVVLKAKVAEFVELYREKVRARREGDQLRLLIHGITEYAIILLDPHGNIVSWNPGAERIKQYRAGEIIGQHFSRFYPQEAIDRGWPAHELQVAQAEGRFEDEGWRVRKDGTQFWANVVITALHDEAGNLRGFSKISRDMTEKMQADENARRLIQEETARRAAEEYAQGIHEQRERLQVTLASIGDAVISTDAGGRVTFLNPVAASLVGWQQDEAQGKPLLDVFNIVNEQTRQPVANPALRALAEGIIVGLANHTVLISRDGTECPIDDSAAPMRNSAGQTIGAVLVFRDITEQKRAERAASKSEHRKTAIVETSLDSIITIDHQGNVVEFNAAAEKTFGYHREAVLGKQLADLIIPPPLRDGHRKGLAHYLATGEGPVLNKRIELPALRADGTEFPVELAITRIPTDGPPLFTAFLRDITGRRWLESQRNARLAVTQTLSQAATVEAASSGILQAVCENLGWDVGCFWMLPPGGEALHCVSSWHRSGAQVEEFEAISRGRTFQRGEGLPGRVWKSGQPAWILDVVQDSNFPRREAASQANLHGAFACPIVVGDKTLGGIEFFSSEIREPNADLLEFMNTVAGQIGQFVERKQAESQLRDSEQRFARFMQHLSGLAWIKDLEGRYVYANDAAKRAFGVQQEQLNGKHDREVFPAETAARFVENDLRALANETGVQVIETLQDEHGVVRHSLVSKFPILGKDGTAAFVGGMAIDITDRIQAEEALRQHKERLELAQHAGRIGTFEWNIQTDEVEWSATEEEIFGLPVGSFGGRLENWKQAVHPDDREQSVAEYLRAVANRADLATEFRIVRPDGQVRWVAARGKVFTDERGHPLRLVGVNVDVTERKDVEMALREADRRKDEFLATLAHELRNPLAPIRNSLQILKLPRVDATTMQQTREMMERQVDHLVRLVDDLLDVSRVMRGKIELRKETVELATIVARAVETVQALIEAQEHGLHLSLPPESLLLDVDPVRLTQVIGNLLTNAAKYTEARGRIWVTAQRDNNEAVLRVRDNGIGIAPDVLPHVFELFVQADHGTTRSQGGLGIGLTLVKNLTEMHQGTVEARSAGLGRGSEFIVRLPLSPRMREERHETDPVVQEQLTSSSGHRLMVVDDNQDAATTLALLLRLHGHEVQVAHDGPSALELVKSYRPEMIFLDIGMPGMDGYEVARRLRRQPELKSMVLAALTGWGQQEDRRRSAEAGFDYHLVKPPDPKALEGLLARLKERLS